MGLTLLLLLVGFLILIKGADFLVNGASSLAKKFNVSNLAIGLTVVAFGTSTPEFVVNLISSLNGKTDASFGNIIGSNNFNLFFILGVAGMLCPIVIQRSTIRKEIPISLFAGILLFVLVNDGLLWGSDQNLLSRIDGIILCIAFSGFMVYVFKTMKNEQLENGESTIKLYSPVVSTLLVILGLVMLVGGGKLVVDGAVAIAVSFGLSERLIGLTILAIGTSLPELATSAVAAYRKNPDIAIGNVVGSNIFNILLILGITPIIQPLPYNTIINTDILVLIGGTILLIIFMFTFKQRMLDRKEAILLFLLYIAYTAYLIISDAQ